MEKFLVKKNYNLIKEHNVFLKNYKLMMISFMKQGWVYVVGERTCATIEQSSS
jgi:hypothetical protein